MSDLMKLIYRIYTNESLCMIYIYILYSYIFDALIRSGRKLKSTQKKGPPVLRSFFFKINVLQIVILSEAA